MRAKELTDDLIQDKKARFVDKLKDPEVAEVHQWAREIQSAIKAKFPGDWKVEVTDPPEDFYADKYIAIHRMSDKRPGSLILNDVFNTAAEIISIPALHDVKFGYMNSFVDVDMEIDIAFGREGLYKRYTPDDLEGQRMIR